MEIIYWRSIKRSLFFGINFTVFEKKLVLPKIKYGRFLLKYILEIFP